MRDGNDEYRKGDNWVVDQRTGERIRSSDARTEWNGAVVHKDDYEERHPQDFVRARRDHQKARDPIRVEPAASFGGPLATTLAAAASAGATSLQVESSTRMVVGDQLRIMLDGGDMFRVAIATIVDAENITIISGLSGAAASGNAVIDETALASVDIG